MGTPEPLVSILTPVYNGEKYLQGCIESVLAQTYSNWDYTIVNNCSTDNTLTIAQHYAIKDERVRVVSNRSFVGAIENHNIAFRLISQNSKYCKLVSADDWIYPECISKMVNLAEEHPSVAIVGAYAVSSRGVSWPGLPVDKSVFPGREVCRQRLLGGPQAMGVPTALLYRSDIVRCEENFYPGSEASADLAACYRSLQNRDFGFVHQILSFERIHDGALTTEKHRFHGFALDHVAFLSRYGRLYLSAEEYRKRYEEALKTYYQRLVAAAIRGNKGEYWQYHKSRLEGIGLKLDKVRLTRGIITKICDSVFNPKTTIEKILRRLSAN